MRRRLFIPIIFILISTFAIHIIGVPWGLPGENTVKLIFGKIEDYYCS